MRRLSMHRLADAIPPPVAATISVFKTIATKQHYLDIIGGAWLFE